MSRIVALSCVLLLALSASVRSEAQTALAPQRDSQAVTVVAQSVATMTSGVGVQDSLALGTVTFADGRSASVRLETKGSSLRNQITFPDHQYVYVISGGTGYMLKDGQKQPLPLWATLYQRAEQIPALGRMSDYVQPLANVRYVAAENVGGRSAYHVRLSNLPSDATPTQIEDLISEFHVFVDAQTFTVVKTQSYLFASDAIENRTLVENYYSDYRSVNGVAVPFHITRYVSSQKNSDLVLSSVSFNNGLPDSDFQ